MQYYVLMLCNTSTPDIRVYYIHVQFVHAGGELRSRTILFCFVPLAKSNYTVIIFWLYEDHA